MDVPPPQPAPPHTLFNPRALPILAVLGPLATPGILMAPSAEKLTSPCTPKATHAYSLTPSQPPVGSIFSVCP